MGKGVVCTLVQGSHEFDVLIGYACTACGEEGEVVVFRGREEDHSFLLLCPNCINKVLAAYAQWNTKFKHWEGG